MTKKKTSLALAPTAQEAPPPVPVSIPLPTTAKGVTQYIIDSAAALSSVKIDDVSLGPWSFSKYKALKKCPFQFFLKYILKVKLPDGLVTKDDPLSANVGSAAHLILEEVLVGKTLEKGFANSHKKYVLVDKAMTQKEWDDHVIPLTYNIEQFSSRIERFGRATPIKRVLTELKIGLTKDFQPTGFFSDDVWLRGVIDLILLLECVDAVVVDHKHGGGEGGIRNYQEQLDWYKVMVHFGVQKMGGVQTGINFIKAGEVKMGAFSPASEIEGNLKAGIEMSITGAIETLLSLGYFKHVRGSYCKWCEFDKVGCASGELKDTELGTKKWVRIHQEPQTPQEPPPWD